MVKKSNRVSNKQYTIQLYQDFRIARDEWMLQKPHSRNYNIDNYNTALKNWYYRYNELTIIMNDIINNFNEGIAFIQF